MHGAKTIRFASKHLIWILICQMRQTGDEAYLAILMDTLPALIAKVKPDMLFYQSAVDVLATDKLGKLALTRDGCAKRDAFVFSIAKAHGIPVAVVMGGGYSENIDDVVEAHCNTFRIAKRYMSNLKKKKPCCCKDRAFKINRCYASKMR